jgi:oligopeptide transport system ATP-binding protein
MSDALPQAANEPILRVEDLKVHFPVTKGIIIQRQVATVRAVDGVSFTIRRGDTLGLVGESGSTSAAACRWSIRIPMGR